MPKNLKTLSSKGVRGNLIAATILMFVAPILAGLSIVFINKYIEKVMGMDKADDLAFKISDHIGLIFLVICIIIAIPFFICSLIAFIKSIKYKYLKKPIAITVLSAIGSVVGLVSIILPLIFMLVSPGTIFKIINLIRSTYEGEPLKPGDKQNLADWCRQIITLVSYVGIGLYSSCFVLTLIGTILSYKFIQKGVVHKTFYKK